MTTTGRTDVTDAPRQLWSALPVLMYHSVSIVPDGPLRPLAVPPARLGEQLTALTEAGYRLMGLSEALAALESGETAPVVALTFDGGYRDFLEHGVGILAAAGARATLYAFAGQLDGPGDWPAADLTALGPMLAVEQLVEVAEAGMEIGNHGWFPHPIDVLPEEQLEREVRDSTDLLAQHLGQPVRSFAYPHGYNSPRVRAMVARHGHTNACELGQRVHRRGGDRFAISRLQITADHRGEDVVCLVRDDATQFIPQLKRAARPGWRLTRRVALRVFDRRLT